MFARRCALAVTLFYVLVACSGSEEIGAPVEHDPEQVAPDDPTPDDPTPDDPTPDDPRPDDPTPDDPGEETEDCLTTEQFFTQRVWAPLMSTTCIACHSSAGAGKDTDLVLKSEAWPGWLDDNLEAIRKVAAFEIDGTSLLLLKPSAQIPHEGGELVPVDTEQYQALEELVERLFTEDTCEPEPVDESGFYAGVTLLDGRGTFRKAALSLAGRTPTVDEDSYLQINGLAGLEPLLDALMTEEAFYDRLKESWNDLLLTDRYDRNKDAINLLNDEDYPNRRWYEDDGFDAEYAFKSLGDKHVNEAVARAPLELIAYVVRNHLPFTEVLTADYMVVNPFSAVTYGIEDAQFDNPTDPDEYVSRHIPGIPHAGILTDPMFLNRFPTTDTNRNRHRSRVVWKLFLATDILALAEQPIDPTSIEDHNPTLFNPNCTVCHQVVDPLAGTFQNWSPQGRYQPPENGWHPDMVAPGFEAENVPDDQHGQSLQWVTQRLAADSRFPTAVVQAVYTMLTGQPVLRPPSEYDDSIQSDAQFGAKTAAWEAQAAFLQQVADDFVAADYDLKTAIKGVVSSAWFRATGLDEEVDELRAVELSGLGTARLLTPEQLNRKIVDTTGYPWRGSVHHNDYLLASNQYRVFYGGIDSDQVVQRITEPSGVMVSVQTRMANEMACRAVTQDLAHQPWERRLFPLVEVSYMPEDNNGFEVPAAEAAIRENVRYLHRHLLGEDLPSDHEEIEATYQLWYETWLEGRAAVLADEESEHLHWSCRATVDWWTGTAYLDGLQVTRDDDYTVRAWMAVLSYLMTDYRYLYE